MIVNKLNIAGLGITFSMIFKEPATITIQYNTIKFISTFIHVNHYYNTAVH